MVRGENKRNTASLDDCRVRAFQSTREPSNGKDTSLVEAPIADGARRLGASGQVVGHQTSADLTDGG
jgi:hypothetical protein